MIPFATTSPRAITVLTKFETQNAFFVAPATKRVLGLDSLFRFFPSISRLYQCHISISFNISLCKHITRERSTRAPLNVRDEALLIWIDGIKPSNNFYSLLLLSYYLFIYLLIDKFIYLFDKSLQYV